MSENEEWPMWICRTYFEYKGVQFSVINGFGTYGGWFGANPGTTGEEFNEFHKYVEYIMGRPVWTHELANEEVQNEIIENSKDDFMNLCKEAVTDGWVKCEDRLPEEGRQVLVYYEYFRYGEYNRMWPCYSVGYQYDGHWCGDVKGHKLNVVAWQPFPDYEGEMEIEEELWKDILLLNITWKLGKSYYCFCFWPSLCFGL